MNMGSQELGPPWNLGQMFMGTQTTMSFFTGLKKSSLCVGVLTKLVADRDKDFGGLLGHLSIN